MDLTTRHLAMQLKNPLAPSASPLSRSIDDARHMEDAGAAAIIMGTTPGGWVAYAREMKQAPRAIAPIIKGIEAWMEAQGFESIDEFRGRVSQINVADPSAFERVNYVNIIDSFTLSPGVSG